MKQQSKTSGRVVTALLAAVAVALAVGWIMDRRALEQGLVASRTANDSLKEKAKRAISERAAAQKELKLTKLALVDADETRVLIGKRLQECEARELALHAKAEKGQKP